MRVPYKKNMLVSESFINVNSNSYYFELCQFVDTIFYDCVIDDDLFVACEFYDCVFDGVFSTTEDNCKIFHGSNFFDRCLFNIYTKKDARAFYKIFRRNVEDRVSGLGPWYLSDSNAIEDPNGFLEEMLRKEK